MAGTKTVSAFKSRYFLTRFSCSSLYSECTALQHLSQPQVRTTVQLTLCNCETVWKEAPLLFLCLVSALGSPAETTAQTLVHVTWISASYFKHSYSGCLSSYPSQNWCSSRTVQPLVCGRISGTEPPPSHSEDLCSYPASL